MREEARKEEAAQLEQVTKWESLRLLPSEKDEAVGGPSV